MKLIINRILFYLNTLPSHRISFCNY